MKTIDWEFHPDEILLDISVDDDPEPRQMTFADLEAEI